MAKQDTLDKPKKFFFDVNDFDNKKEVVEENLPPPPPTFSEAELDTAKNTSFKSGRDAGLAEADAKREKFVSGLLENIIKNMNTLIAAEDKRERRFEAESVILARAIFNRLFPGMNERGGLDEVERVILNVLESRKEHPEIIVEVHADYVPDVQSYVEQALSRLQIKGICTVRAGENLGIADCRMRWNDGGAMRDITGLAAQIEAELQQVLAGRPGLRDNGG